ncbi:MAG: 4Fe-4S binding protein [Candidatus Limnocylindrales bacterium]|jgi:ferredoxin
MSVAPLTTTPVVGVVSDPGADPLLSNGNWADLYREVVSTGLCTGCGSCVLACPFRKLQYVDFRPSHLEDAAGETVLRKAAGVPPRGLEDPPAVR